MPFRVVLLISTLIAPQTLFKVLALIMNDISIGKKRSFLLLLVLEGSVTVVCCVDLMLMLILMLIHVYRRLLKVFLTESGTEL